MFAIQSHVKTIEPELIRDIRVDVAVAVHQKNSASGKIQEQWHESLVGTAFWNGIAETLLQCREIEIRIILAGAIF